ncbi:MAG: hypothetical protein BWY70_00369 [Bacteroidetes bacterium ADurb.Bin408]|nr:MAG: hypothetical protein BWY70_00369 [Bacteroidetes bacterium ADurb.Bin408]
MKKVNKILVLLLVAVFAIPILNSCKKGEGDPSLSLRSREGRLKGEWKLVSGTETGTSGTTTYTATFTETMCTYVYGGNSQSFTYTEVVEFLKGNEFKSTITEDGQIETCEGYWAFMDGYDEYANKEMVVIRVKSTMSGGTVHTYTGDKMPMYILRFNKLANSECIIEAEGTSTSGSSTSSSTSTKTYEKD